MSHPTPRRTTAVRFASLLALSFGVGGGLPPAAEAQAPPLPSIAEKTRGTQKMEGLFNLYWQESTGSLFWEIGDLDAEFLYSVSMGSGLGSNPIGIDRGQVRGNYVLKPMRVGPRVLLMEPNYSFVANSDNRMEVAAVKDAFAPSVHWGFDVVAETDGRVLVDATAFFLRDARGVVEQIARSGQGRFQLDKTRSAIYLPSTKSFPENTEVEAILTFTSSEPGRLVQGVAASGDAVTLREHHSFVRLPGPGYETRIADPRIGVNGPNVADYAKPIDQDMTVRLVARHRLQRKTQGTGPSEAVEPIVYYVDPGTPEPIRSALLEGAGWWNQAFEAAGFVNAFQVKVLPDSIDPQDIRYNMIHWTHRRTRGYSYGNSIVDPRTGEIIRGVVNLGSLRLRQDYLHGQGMVAPFPGGISSDDGGGWFDDDASGSCDLSAAPDFEYLSQVARGSDAFEMALARVRQLAAHEVGHTLGFPHNYIASAYGRESVMDYPAPLVEIDADGDLDLSNAYLRRIGAYDKLAVNWLYREFPAGTDEAAALEAIVRDGLDRGLRYVGHTNNNFIGAGHQYAGVWDNGANLVDQLKTEIRIRRIGLDRFG
ncbi:MAG TPA: zinc-dependent metalloprotease, partial [Longimicrobiales bacterium]|nr:zinc-dependent metalloprotease [Longimicrobiales bacterium]